MRVTYEWDIETLDPESGDVLDHHHADHLRDLPRVEEHQALVLVRDSDSDGRAWAYVADGVLPETFTDAYDRPVARVPKRFHAELAKAVSS